MSLIGLVGQAWANATGTAQAKPTAAKAAVITLRLSSVRREVEWL
jgi:hypothetical protein